MIRTPKVSRAKMGLLTKQLNALFEDFAKLNPNINYETIVQAARSSDTDRLADTIAANLPISIEEQAVSAGDCRLKRENGEDLRVY